MAIVNFIFVYCVVGFILSNFLLNVSRKPLDTSFNYLLGYGIAPLAVSLQLYYLYWLWPGHDWIFYAMIVYAVWFLFSITTIVYYKTLPNISSIGRAVSHGWKGVLKLPLTAKLFLVFIICIVGFIFIRGQLYPNLWADAIYYFQQGHVYSFDRSLDRLFTQIPFAEDGTWYVMNPSIRPAIPVLYSFFFTDPAIQDIFIFSGSFLYFYYFILTLGIFAYILKKFRCDAGRILLGLVLLISSYYLANFLIYGFKEIILIFFLLVSLFIIDLAKESNPKATVYLSALFGVSVGLSIYINLSGVIIGGVVGLIYFVVLLIKKVSWRGLLFNLVTVGIFLVLCSGGELKNDLGFIFKSNLFKASSSIGATEASEYSSYKISEPTVADEATPEVITPVVEVEPVPVPETVTPEPVATVETITPVVEVVEPVVEAEPVIEPVAMVETTTPVEPTIATDLKTQILIKGKLQGLTQVQFYGIIFSVFMILLVVRLVQAAKFTYFEKILLVFCGLFFFIVMDPFFLNAHPQAYVLSISPKYTILLIPLVALFITLNYGIIQKLFAWIPTPYFLGLSVFTLLLFPVMRQTVAQITLDFVSTVIPFYNDAEYYLEKIDVFYLGVGGFALVVTVLIVYVLVAKLAQAKKINVINFLFIAGCFVLPFGFLLNNNYDIVYTFKKILAPTTVKLVTAPTNNETITLLDVVEYINTQIDPQQKILLLHAPPLIYYVHDYHRFVVDLWSNIVDESGRKHPNIQDAGYILVAASDLPNYDFTVEVVTERDFGDVVILRVVR